MFNKSNVPSLAAVALAAFHFQGEPAQAAPHDGSNIIKVYNNGAVNPDGPEFRMRVSYTGGRSREVDVDVCTLREAKRPDDTPGLTPQENFLAGFNVETQQLLGVTTRQQRQAALRDVSSRGRDAIAAHPHVFEVGVLARMQPIDQIKVVAAIDSNSIDNGKIAYLFTHVTKAHGVAPTEISEAAEMAKLYYETRQGYSTLNGVDFSSRGGQPQPNAEDVCPR